MHFSEVLITCDLQEKINKLQYEVMTYMNNNVRGQKQSTQRSGQPTKSIVDRLKGKEGRIRANLMGKRVDFSARSVITPDALMDVDEVGIPEKIAAMLTIPERVNAENIERLTQRVHRGSNHVDGADNVVTTSGVMINLASCQNRNKIRLQYGWIVERYLCDGDVVIFNRQPSLHKMGMMGHKVKITPGLTFRLNLCCANPYNADFDGDEMNLHVPQSCNAMADVGTLMMVGRQIISPQANKPVMGIVQDSLLGAHLMSIDDVLVNKKMACHYVSFVRYSEKRLPAPCICHPVELWSGKQLLGLLLPQMLTLGVAPTGADVAQHTSLYVRCGQFVCGHMSKSNIGTAAGGFVDVLFRDFGSTIAIRWMSDMQRLTNAWLMDRGFAVGVKDCVLSTQGETRVSERIEKAIQLADDIMQEKVGAQTREAHILESTVMRILSKTLMQTGSIVEEELGNDNAIRAMVNAGSKGNPINLSQICGCVGQQSIEGRRVIPEKGARTLSCFDFDDKTLAGRGFVQNSYALGLQPHEYFFHAMGGREGLVDTAVKTATTGYIQRRQIKSMEDHKVFYDGTVRNADECIVDFRYGGDSFDACKLERYRLDLLRTTDAAIRDSMTEWEACEAIVAKNKLLACKKSADGELDIRVLLPFNPDRMRLDHTVAQTATVAPPFEAIEELVQVFVDTQDLYAIKASVLQNFHASALAKLHYSLDDIQRLFHRIGEKIDDATVNPGEMVGSVAAQSIGEPATQMTLNTFHMSGVGNKNVTQGIPRLKELLDQAKHIKTPCISIALHAPFSHNKAFADYFASTLPLTRLGEIVTSCSILHEPDPAVTKVEADISVVADDSVWHTPHSNISEFVVRMELNQDYMKARHITPPIVRTLLRSRLRDKAHVISSETNSTDWVLRVRFHYLRDMMTKMQLNTEREGLLCHRAVSILLDTMAISGHKDVKEASVRVVNHNDFVVDTRGCNFIDLSVAPCVDWYNTTSNDVSEIHTCLGIEAAVTVLYSELTATISFDGTYVDPRHIMMIVNTMTRGGYIMPLSRHGLNRMSTGPLLRCTFEETPDILCDAACFSELDNGKGVSQNIIAGRLASIGSGITRIEMDVNCLHPRTINVVGEMKRTVLKSTIRSFQPRPDEMEFVCYERDNNNTQSNDGDRGATPDMEPPFKDPDPQQSMIYLGPGSSSSKIFSCGKLQLPFFSENVAESANVRNSDVSRTNKHYRPSSPTCDDV